MTKSKAYSYLCLWLFESEKLEFLKNNIRMDYEAVKMLRGAYETLRELAGLIIAYSSNTPPDNVTDTKNYDERAELLL